MTPAKGEVVSDTALPEYTPGTSVAPVKGLSATEASTGDAASAPRTPSTEGLKLSTPDGPVPTCSCGRSAWEFPSVAPPSSTSKPSWSSEPDLGKGAEFPTDSS